MVINQPSARMKLIRHNLRKTLCLVHNRYPGFPVKLIEVKEIDAAFLTESRTRGLGRRSAQEVRVLSIWTNAATFSVIQR